MMKSSFASHRLRLFAVLALFGSAHRFVPGCGAAPLPAANLNVRDFGARGDGSTDDAPAINRALAAAVQHAPGTVLRFPAGTYCLGERSATPPAGKGGSQLGVVHADGLTIEGEDGAVLLSRKLTQS